MSRQCIGLDIGSSSIKLVQLQVARNKTTTLQNFGIEPLPPQAVVNGEVMNPGVLTDALKQLVGRIHLRGKEVCVGVAGNGVIVKRLTIPHLDGPALDEQMEWEVRQNIPFPREDVEVDYDVIVPQTPDGQMEVVLVAAKREVLDQYLRCVRGAGLQTACVDAAAFSVLNAVESSVGWSPGEAIALINVGASYSTITLVHAGLPLFTRDVAIGGNDYTEAIQQRLGVPFDGAEAYKVGGTNAGVADVVPQEVHRILAEMSDRVAGEFQRTLDFFAGQRPDVQLARVFLTGGTALIPQLPKAIMDRTRVPAHILDPFARSKVDARRFDTAYLKATAPMAALAFGLALRQVGDK